MSQEVFTIDLARCTGCDTCRVACRDRAGLADGVEWLRVQAHEDGAYPHPRLTYRVVHCFHCAEPPCVGVCPVGAITREKGGLVQISEAECIGCRACVDGCPFGAITMRPDAVATKCDGCVDEVRAGYEPTCVRACPMRALGFGSRAFSGRDREDDPSFDAHAAEPRVVYLVRPR